MKSLSIKKDFTQTKASAVLSFITLVLLAWLVILAAFQNAKASDLTLVSLTFDDSKNQSAARAILANHGMHATFYVNTDRIGIGAPYLSKAELDGLYADGNEIGGHTIGHVDLATLTDAAQKTAICNDMQTLFNWGYQINSFAYPFHPLAPPHKAYSQRAAQVSVRMKVRVRWVVWCLVQVVLAVRGLKVYPLLIVIT